MKYCGLSWKQTFELVYTTATELAIINVIQNSDIQDTFILAVVTMCHPHSQDFIFVIFIYFCLWKVLTSFSF